MIWVGVQQNKHSEMCLQQRFSLASAPTQSDQSLGHPLEEALGLSLLKERHEKTTDEEADFSLHWTNTSFRRICCTLAIIIVINIYQNAINVLINTHSM